MNFTRFFFEDQQLILKLKLYPHPSPYPYVKTSADTQSQPVPKTHTSQVLTAQRKTSTIRLLMSISRVEPLLINVAERLRAVLCQIFHILCLATACATHQTKKITA